MNDRIRARVRPFSSKPGTETWVFESQHCLSIPHIGEAIDRHTYGVRLYQATYSMPRELHHGHPILVDTPEIGVRCTDRCLWLDTCPEDLPPGANEIANRGR